MKLYKLAIQTMASASKASNAQGASRNNAAAAIAAPACTKIRTAAGSARKSSINDTVTTSANGASQRHETETVVKATSHPAQIAMPPIRGTGRTCRDRALGRASGAGMIPAASIHATHSAITPLPRIENAWK
jgi:hypothetical protein